MLKWRFSALVLICSMMLFVGTGAAGAAEPEKKKTEKTTAIEDMTVTATKTDANEDLAPVAAFSVNRDDIKSQPNHYMDNFGEYIRDIPGVHVAQYYPWGPPWVHLRGTGHFLQRTVYLIDGVPIHAFLSPAINTNDIEKVDVVLGPSSALYGASAAGGAVNIITRSGREGDGAYAKVSYGSNNTFRPHVSVGNKVGGFNYYFSYSGDISDGFQMKPIDGMVDLYKLGKKQYVPTASVEDNRYESQWLTGKVGWESAGGSTLTFSVNYQNRYLYGGQPNYIINDYGDTLVSSLRFSTPLGDWGKVTATTGYQFQSIPSQDNGRARLVGDQVVVNDTITARTDWDRRRIPFEVQGDFYLGDSNILTAGVYMAQETEDMDTYKGTTSQQTYRYDLTTDMFAVYLQDQAFFFDEKLSVLAGVRYDYWKYHSIYDSGSSNKEPDSVKKEKFTYRGGVKYKVNDSVAFRASAGTAYWPGNPKWFFQNLNTGPTWREANPDLEPEETWMVDFGTDIKLNRWGTLLRATAYYGVIDNIMSYTYEAHPTLPGTTLVRSRNIGEAEIYGLELYLKQPITDHLSFTGSLTLNQSKITEDKVKPENIGNQLRNSPDYWGSLALRYVNDDLFNWEVLYRFSDDRYYDDNNEDLPYFHMEAYQTMDVKIWKDWDLNNKWILHTGVSAVNLFDEQYATEIVYVNPGRYIETQVGLRYKF